MLNIAEGWVMSSRSQEPDWTSVAVSKRQQRGRYRRQHPYRSHHRPAITSDIFVPRSEQFVAGPRCPVAEVPVADPSELAAISEDRPGFINVRGSLKEVRFYGEGAVVMMSDDDPRDIAFQPGSRRVVVDDTDIVVLSFNSPYTDYVFSDGSAAKIRLGAPTRDFFIDGSFVDVKFGGPPVDVPVGGSTHKIQLGGPNQQVCIGGVRRGDVVAGRVNLIVDEDLNNVFKMYLDSKPQLFDINGTPIIIRFADSLQRVFINGVPFTMEFGGSSVPIMFNNQIHHLRLSGLPQGVMSGLAHAVGRSNFIVQSKGDLIQSTPTVIATTMTSSSDVSDDQYHKNYNGLNIEFQEMKHFLNNTTVCIQSQYNGSNSSYVTQLYHKLVETGLIQSNKQEDNTLKEQVDFSRPESLKVRNMDFVFSLYVGTQCQICSLRFSKRKGDYDSHLDWHFQRKRHESFESNKWWSHPSEFPIREGDFKQLCWFDKQNRPKVFVEMDELTVPAKKYGEEPKCFACLEGFKEFYNEDFEEWHLKNAVAFDDKLFHPICSQDYTDKKSKHKHPVEKNGPSVSEVITIIDDCLTENNDKCVGQEMQHKPEVESNNDPTTNNDGVNNDLMNKTVYDSDEDPLEIIEINPITETIDLLEEDEAKASEIISTQVTDLSSKEIMIGTSKDNLLSATQASSSETCLMSSSTPVINKKLPIKINISSKLITKKNDENRITENSQKYASKSRAQLEIVEELESIQYIGKERSALCCIM